MVRINKAKANYFLKKLKNLQYPQRIKDDAELDFLIIDIFSFDSVIIGSLTSCTVNQKDIDTWDIYYNDVKDIDFKELKSNINENNAKIIIASAYLNELKNAYFFLKKEVEKNK